MLVIRSSFIVMTIFSSDLTIFSSDLTIFSSDL